MRVRYWMAAALVVAGCGELVPGLSDAGSEPKVDPCDPVPDNGSADAALPFIMGDTVVGKYCREQGGPSRGFFRNVGSFRDGTRVKLRVDFERGSAAGDLDFNVGRLNGNSNGVTGGSVVSGSCRNPSGQPEECVTEIRAAEADGGFTEVWVVANPVDELVEAEVYRFTLTEVQRPSQP